MNAKSGSLLSPRSRTKSRNTLVGLAVVVGLAVSACSSGEDPVASDNETTSTAAASTTSEAETTDSSNDVAENESDPADDQLFPDVVAVEATSEGGNSWSFSVTLSSPYDSPDRYADSWRVVGPDGTVYGERFLTHDHAAEQPFTRSQSGIEIPADVLTVTVEGRDQVSGWGGTTVEYMLPR